jgi:hypothetical protein
MPSNIRNMHGQEWSPQAFEQGFDGPGPNQQHWPPGPPWGWGGPPFGCGCPPQRPPCPPGPGWDWNWRPPLGAIRGPIIGVTDGSTAQPGEVGEYLQGIIDYTNVPAPPGGVDGVVSAIVTPLILPPGDWDVEVTFRAGYGLNSFFASLTPLPTGVTSAFVIAATPEVDMRFFDWTFQGPRGAANVSVPTLLAFTVNLGIVGGTSETNGGAPGSGGWFTTIVTARRMR